MQHLYVQRQRYMLIEVLKIYHKQGPLYSHDLFESPSNARWYGRNDKRLVQPKCRTETYGINSFRYQGAKVWNALDQKLKNAMSTDDFRKCILQWKGFECSCSYCNMCILKML